MKTILITTYSPCIHGSYGIVSKEIFQRIFDEKKYRIIHHGWFHADLATQVPWQVIPTKAKQVNNHMELIASDIHGQESFKELMAQIKPDIVWALGDFYMLNHVFAEKKNYPSTQFIGYVAVDGEPWHTGNVHTVKDADYIYSMSNFGAEILTKLTGKPAKYIWSGVDLNKFFPVSKEEKMDLRKKSTNNVFNEDTFVAGFVGKIQYRKQNDKIWEYVHYMVHGDYILCNDCDRVTLMEWDPTNGTQRHPSKLTTYDINYDYSYCSHCRSLNITKGKPNNKFYGYVHSPFKPDDSWNPDLLAAIWRVQGKILNTKNLGSNKGIDEQNMVSIYNLFDMMYYPSGGEGFGMPVLEAMACGIPTMYTNYSSHAEVAANVGIPIKCTYVTEHLSCYNRARADTADAVRKTLKILDNRSLLENLSAKCIEKAKDYTWDIISKQWSDVIADAAKKNTNAIGVII